MRSVRIIPCMDIYNGRVIKGEHFVHFKDAGDPIEMARYYNESGADELAFLDISATNEERKTTVELVKKVAKEVKIPFTVGGGISSIDIAKEVLEAGATKVSINSAAVKNPEFINEAVKCFGSERIIVAVDVKKREGANGYDVIINGGTVNTGKDAVLWSLEMEKRGASEILLTSMDGDGTKEGYDLEATKLVAEAVKIPVTASGGAGKLDDFYNAVTVGKAQAVLAASLFHFRILTVKEVKEYLRSKGLDIN